MYTLAKEIEILSHFESFYFLVKSRYDCIKTNFRDKKFFRGQKVFLSPKIGFFIPENHFLSPKFICIRHGLRSTSLPDSKILEEWSKILPYSSLCETLALLSNFTYKSSPKCDKITYVPISGFFPVTKKWNRVLVLLETFRSNFEFF